MGWCGQYSSLSKIFLHFVSLVLSLDRVFPPLAHPMDLHSLRTAMVAGGADDQQVSFSVRHFALLMCCLQLGVVRFEKGRGGHPAHRHRAELEDRQTKDCRWLEVQYHLVIRDFPHKVHLPRRRGVGQHSCLRKKYSSR